MIQTGPRGLSLCLCEWGPAQGRPLVILHGFLEQGAAWDTVAKALGRRVIAPDHRGHGRSEHVGTGGFYHFWNYIPDVDAVLDAVSPNEPVDLVGHSMGGTMACLFAATRPARVRRLALIEGLGPPDMTEQAMTRPARFTHAVRSPPTHKPMKDLADAASRITRFTPSLTEERALALADRVSRPLSNTECQAAGMAHGARVWTWDPLHRSPNPIPFSTATFRPFLGRIACSTLHIHGDTSGFRPADQQERMASVPNLTSASLPGGHMLHHDVPGALAEALSAFFDADS